MNKLVIIPMLPIRMRYSAWWNTVFPSRLRELLCGTMDVTTPTLLGSTYESFDNTPSFCQKQVDWEIDWLCYLHNLHLKPSDVVLVLDCTTPGLIGSYITTHKPCHFMGICHGTSFNRLDIFSVTRNTFDAAILREYDKVLVASEYHKLKLATSLRRQQVFSAHRIVNMRALPGMVNECNIKLPVLPSFTDRQNICVVDRPSAQKRNLGLLLRVAKKLKPLNISILDIHGGCGAWDEYLAAVANFKFMLVTAQEETYGYQVHDAMSVGTIPIVPSDLAYPEYVPSEYCYLRVTRSIDDDVTAENIVKVITTEMEKRKENTDTYPIVPLNQPYINTFFASLVQEVYALSESGR